MSNITCPICGNAGGVKVLSSKSQQQADIGAWNCGDCRHAWRTEPWRTSGALEFFEDAEYTKIENAERLDATKMRLFELFLRWAEEIRPGPPRQMVDFGCSYGTVLQMFKEHDWQVMGIEISPNAQKVLSEMNLPWARHLEESGLAPASVDVVTMCDCVYYLPDPVGSLETIRQYLKPDGGLFLRQPTRGGLLHVLLKFCREKPQDPRIWCDHVHLFSRRSTELALERAGFAKVEFLKEKDFKRSAKGEMIHRLLRMADFLTCGVLDLTASWTVTARAGSE
jgi:SAM-dependent methyltransferase